MVGESTDSPAQSVAGSVQPFMALIMINLIRREGGNQIGSIAQW